MQSSATYNTYPWPAYAHPQLSAAARRFISWEIASRTSASYYVSPNHERVIRDDHKPIRVNPDGMRPRVKQFEKVGGKRRRGRISSVRFGGEKSDAETLPGIGGSRWILRDLFHHWKSVLSYRCCSQATSLFVLFHAFEEIIRHYRATVGNATIDEYKASRWDIFWMNRHAHRRTWNLCSHLRIRRGFFEPCLATLSMRLAGSRETSGGHSR